MGRIKNKGQTPGSGQNVTDNGGKVRAGLK